MVPANRVRALAEALEVTVEELLDGVTAAQPVPSKSALEETALRVPNALAEDRVVRAHRLDNTPLLRLVPSPTSVDDGVTTTIEGPGTDQWVVPERPPLDGWIPEGWVLADRIQDISPSLPDGYWLDPIKLEKGTARQLLKTRLCAADQRVVGDRKVPGAALAERLYSHCSRQDAFFTSSRLPLAETIFRCVVSADHGGLTDGALVEMLRERSGAASVSAALLRRLRDSVRPYPIRRVDAELFGGRR
jgi:hypothetical protein